MKSRDALRPRHSSRRPRETHGSSRHHDVRGDIHPRGVRSRRRPGRRRQARRANLPLRRKHPESRHASPIQRRLAYGQRGVQHRQAHQRAREEDQGRPRARVQGHQQDPREAQLHGRGPGAVEHRRPGGHPG